MNVYLMTSLLTACGLDASAPAEAPLPAAAVPAPVAAPAQVVEVDAACDVQLFVYEAEPEGLTVYQAPQRGAEIVGVYPFDTVVSVTGVSGPWARMKATDDDGKPLVEGWAGIELLTTNVRTPEEYGAGTRPSYYAGPEGQGALSPIALPIDSITVKGCYGALIKAEWVDAKGKNGTGWLPASAHCPQPNTTCP